MRKINSVIAIITAATVLLTSPVYAFSASAADTPAEEIVLQEDSVITSDETADSEGGDSAEEIPVKDDEVTASEETSVPEDESSFAEDTPVQDDEGAASEESTVPDDSGSSDGEYIIQEDIFLTEPDAAPEDAGSQAGEAVTADDAGSQNAGNALITEQSDAIVFDRDYEVIPSLLEEQASFEPATGKTYTISHPIANGTYVFRSALNKKYVLDVVNGSKASGANVQLFKYNGSKAQYFRVVYVGYGYYKIINLRSGKAIDVNGKKCSNFTNIRQYKWNGKKAQLWKPVKNDDGSFTFVSALGARYALDVHGAKAVNKSNITTYRRNGTKAQKWYLTTKKGAKPKKFVKRFNDIKGGTYVIKSVLDQSKVIDIESASTKNKANAQLYKYNKTTAQVFMIKKFGHSYKIINVNSGKALQVLSKKASNGRNVGQMTRKDIKSQAWHFVKNDDGSFTIVSAINENFALDLSGGKTENGANIRLYGRNKTGSQKWILKKVTTYVPGYSDLGTQITTGMPIPHYSQDGSRYQCLYRGVNMSGGACGPTSLAMVLSYLHDKKITPDVVCQTPGAEDNGWNGGSSDVIGLTRFFGRIGYCSYMYWTTNIYTVVNALRNGHPVIMLTSNKLFTHSQHIIVLRGVSKNGNVYVNDPSEYFYSWKAGYETREFSPEEIANEMYIVFPTRAQVKSGEYKQLQNLYTSIGSLPPETLADGRPASAVR